MKIEDLMSYQYLNMKEIHANASLFFNEKNELLPESPTSFYVLFQPEKKMMNGISVFNRAIYMGERTTYLFDKLVELKGDESQLDILPGYFVYDDEYYLITEVDFDSKQYAIADFLEALVHIEELTIKCHFDKKQVGDVFTHLEGMRRILQTTITDRSLIKTISRDDDLEHVKIFIREQLLMSHQFYGLTVMLQIKAPSHEKLTEIYQKIHLLAKLQLFQLKRYFFIQYDLIEKFYLQKTRLPTKENYLLLSSNALKTDFPFAQLGLYDDDGKYLGIDVNGHPVFIDMWKRDEQRVNSNFLILGQSGQGKTTLATKIIEQSPTEKIYLFDPESEYHLENGDDVARIVLKEGQLIEELFDMNLTDEFSIAFFVQHFTYVTNACFEQQQVFQVFLQKVGSLKNIDKVKLLFSKMQLPSLIRTYVNKIVNAPKISIRSDKRIQHFSIHANQQVLSDASRILYYELLSYIWLTMLQTSQRKIFLIDEAYLLFQNGDQMLTTLLQNMFKRMRKYNGSIGLITQNIGDYTVPTNKHALMTIFDNANYQFIFKSEGADRQHLIELLSLSQKNTEQLDELKRGECLLVCRRTQIGKLTTFYRS